VSGSGISWARCKSAPRSTQITMPAPHHSFTGWMPFLPPNQQRQSTEGITNTNNTKLYLLLRLQEHTYKKKPKNMMPRKITNQTSSSSDPQIHSRVNGHHTLLKNKSVYISYFLDNTSVKITKTGSCMPGDISLNFL